MASSHFQEESLEILKLQHQKRESSVNKYYLNDTLVTEDRRMKRKKKAQKIGIDKEELISIQDSVTTGEQYKSKITEDLLLKLRSKLDIPKSIELSGLRAENFLLLLVDWFALGNYLLHLDYLVLLVRQQNPKPTWPPLSTFGRRLGFVVDWKSTTRRWRQWWWQSEGLKGFSEKRELSYW